MKAWYFSDGTKKLRYRDGREIAIGTTHTVEGEIIPCRHGLHGSVQLIDALKYAPGTVLWEVELEGTLVEHSDHDKWAASERTYLRGGIDISDVLRAFARFAALFVAHLWDMPEIVHKYLETGNESLRIAAAAAADTHAAASAYAAYTACAISASASAYAANAANAASAYTAAACAAAQSACVAAHAISAIYATAYDANAEKQSDDELNAKLVEMVEAFWLERKPK